MPAQIAGLEIMDEDRLIEEVLDKFVNCHEQTYEEFLNTFTYISKDNETRRGTFETYSSENNFTSVTFPHRNEPNDHHLGNKTTVLHTSSQCSEGEQVVVDEGQKVGSFVQGDLNPAGKVKVNNFLELEDLDMDEEIKVHVSHDDFHGGVSPPTEGGVACWDPLKEGTFWRDSLFLVEPCESQQTLPCSPCALSDLLLPGEVEPDVSTSVPSYFPSVDRLLTCEGKPRLTVKGADKQMEEILGDEVQPFSLDEEFDYDNVVLTPKFTPAEMDTVKELAKQKRENTGTDLEEPRD